VTEAQHGYGFGMLPGHGLRDRYLSSLALDGSPACKLSTAPELEWSPSRRPCLMGRGVNPTLHSQMCTPDHPLHQIAWFLVFWQGGLSEAQNGYGLGMIPGHGPVNGQFSSSALVASCPQHLSMKTACLGAHA